MADAPAFSKLVPGFDFLQGLVKNAGSALPSIGQWVAPTLNPEELDKRIEELRTVQFWLEQNARMLGATIQALEVQRMTLSTLKTMNVQMDDLRESLTIRIPPDAAPAAAASRQKARTPASPPAGEAGTKPARARKAATAPAGEGAPPAVDPMQWWGALTKQFSELAASAMKDAEGTKSPAGTATKSATDDASQTAAKAAAAAAGVVRKAAARKRVKTP